LLLDLHQIVLLASSECRMSTIRDTTAAPISPLLVLPQPVLPREWSMADLQQHLGNVPPKRIRLFPPLGTATVQDALSIADHEGVLCELVDGVLVEKVMASYEAILAGILIGLLNEYLHKNPCGVAMPGDGPVRLLPRRMRYPDVSFISWDRFPNRKLPDAAVYEVAPDLAVEILSEGNTEGEMDVKLKEYFQAGVRLVWYIDPRSRTARIFIAVDREQFIEETGVLDGRDVLPGFRLRLGELFERVPRAQ
jgi:Uma2 family endonuclease